MWTSSGKQVAKQWRYLRLPLSCLNLTQRSPILFKHKRRRKESWGGKERATHTHGLRNTSGDHGSLVSSFFVCWFICLFVFSNFLQNRGEKTSEFYLFCFVTETKKGRRITRKTQRKFTKILTLEFIPGAQGQSFFSFFFSFMFSTLSATTILCFCNNNNKNPYTQSKKQ